MELGRGLTRSGLAKYFYQKHGRLLEEWRIRKEILPALESARLISIEPDPNDRRVKLIIPLYMEGETSPTHFL